MVDKFGSSRLTADFRGPFNPPGTVSSSGLVAAAPVAAQYSLIFSAVAISAMVA